MLRSLILGVGLLSVVGCGGNSQSPSNIEPTRSSDPQAQTEEGRSTNAAMVWTTVPTPPQELARSVDQAIFGLEGARATFLISASDDRGKGTTSGSWLVLDKDRFFIEFARSDRVELMKALIANGTEFATSSPTGWSNPSPLPSGWKDSVSDTWPKFISYFPLMLARPLYARTAVFEPLIQALGSKGYRVQYQVAESEYNGKTRPFARLLATPPRGGLKVDMRFDGIRLVPLTIRLIDERAKPIPKEYLWTAEWSFEQEFEESVFEIPK